MSGRSVQLAIGFPNHGVKRFGHWLVIGLVPPSHQRFFAECTHCGQVEELTQAQLDRQKPCPGCARDEYQKQLTPKIPRQGPEEDLSRGRSGLLRILEPTTGGRYRCKCACGKFVVVHGTSLADQSVKSCGCVRKKMRSLGWETPKHRKSPEQKMLHNITQGCHNPRCPTYHKYGAKGIKVCDAWRSSFKAFIADLGERPGPNYTLGRYDETGDYAPGNCYWKQTDRNVDGSGGFRLISIEIDGKVETRSLTEWAILYGMPIHTFQARLRQDWDPYIALTTPVRQYRKK